MHPPLSPRDALHLAALRGAKRRAEDLNVRGKRRDEVCATYMEAAYTTLASTTLLSSEDCAELACSVSCIYERGFREVLTQLHVLEGRK